MNRQQKETVVKKISDQLKAAKASFLVNYKGLTVAQLQGFRGQLRETGGCFKVSKARLMKRATDGINGMAAFSDAFKDQVGFVFAEGEIPAVAKAMVEFRKKNEQFGIISGFTESRIMELVEIETLASLPSRDVLFAILAGTIQAPIAALARVLNKIAGKE